MVPFERALVSSYRLSLVTFPLSLRVSEILPVLCSSTPLFPTPPLVSPKFTHVPPGVEPSVGLIVRTIISFQDFQTMWSRSTYVTDGQTDGQTDDMQSQYRALQYSASRGNRKNY